MFLAIYRGIGTGRHLLLSSGVGPSMGSVVFGPHTFGAGAGLDRAVPSPFGPAVAERSQETMSLLIIPFKICLEPFFINFH